MADRAPKRQVVLVTVAALAAALLLFVGHSFSPSSGPAVRSDPDENADLQISGAGSPGCRKLRALLVGPFGATFTKISPSGDTVFLQHPLTDSLTLSCIGQSLSNVFLSKDGVTTPATWFSLAGYAGAIMTGAPAKDVETVVRACVTQAYDDAFEQAKLDSPVAHVECQAFRRDGGNVNVSIYRP